MKLQALHPEKKIVPGIIKSTGSIDLTWGLALQHIHFSMVRGGGTTDQLQNIAMHLQKGRHLSVVQRH